ncbi:16105_t:CDS:2, partial [Racocetra fulgida]
FAIDIDNNMLISYLKKVIKSELHPQFDNVIPKDIKLWKVEIRDNNIGALSNLSLHDNDEILPTRKVKEYWPNAPEKEHIHIIVSLSTSFNLSTRYFEIFSYKIWSLEHFVVSSIYSNNSIVDKDNTHRAFYKILDNISNNQTIQQEVRDHAKRLLQTKANNHIAKLDDDTIEVNQSSINVTSIETKNSNDTPISDVSDNNLELASYTKTVNINSAELYSSDSSDEVSELDRNQITEQILKQDFIKSTVIAKSNGIDNELSLEKTIEGSMQCLAYWFEKAIKSGIKEILYWYTYSLETENKVKNMSADRKIKEKTARSMIYKEMLKYLPNVTP